jgi:hypothetical protein
MLFAGWSQDVFFLGIEAPLAIDQAKEVGLVAVFDLLDDLPRLPNAYWQEYTTKVVAPGSHNLSPLVPTPETEQVEFRLNKHIGDWPKMLIAVFVSLYPQDTTGSADIRIARLEISLRQGCGDLDASLSIFS